MSGILGTFQKQPADILDFDIDFTDWLAEADANDALSTVSSVIVSATAGSTFALGASAIFDLNRQVKVWTSLGVDGDLIKIKTTVTTVNGRTKEVDWRMRVRERS